MVQCSHGGRGCSFHPPPPLFRFSIFFFGGAAFSRHAQSKQSSVNTGRKMGKHGFVVTCVLTEGPCAVDIPDIKPVVLYFFPSSLLGEMF